MLDRLFKLREHNTDVKTEVLAGITSFIAMAYIIFVNPSILSAAKMDFNSVLMATCIGAALGCFLTAILANVPFCQAPGMGMNAFFAYTLCGTMGYTWQQGLSVVFLSGLIFLIITVTPLRGRIIAAIPNDMKSAITGGIGLFIALVGLFNSGIVHTTEAGKLALGNITSGAPLVAVIGILIVSILIARNVKRALILGILAIMPFAYSISDGIGFGFISYVMIKLFRGKGREVSSILYVLALIFVVKYVLSSII